jgi:hypothetical protein
MPTIKVKMTSPNVMTSTSSFYDDNQPASAHPVLSTNGPLGNGTPLLVTLPSGTYTLLCTVSGAPGPFGPVTVLDSNNNQIGINPVPATIHPNGTGTAQVRFTVGMATASSAGARSKMPAKPKRVAKRKH